MRLTGVFDERQLMSRGDAFERAHVGGLTVEVHRQDRPRPRCHRGRGRVGIERQAVRIDVGEHRARAGHHDRERRIGGRQRRRDDFVAGTDVEGAQDQRDRVGAGADAHGVRLRHAAANSASNASTSGPSTNQPLVTTRAIAAVTAARRRRGRAR